MMYDSKTMKIVSFDRAKKMMLNGETIYMAGPDGTLTEITEQTTWQNLLFHNMQGGVYVAMKKKFTGIGEFAKDIHIGKHKFTIEHSKEEGGGAFWKFASCRENQ